MIIARQERERERERELLAYIGTRRDFTDQGYGTIAISSSSSSSLLLFFLSLLRMLCISRWVLRGHVVLTHYITCWD